MNENNPIKDILKGVFITLTAALHPNPAAVIAAIEADYQVGVDIVDLTTKHLNNDDHIRGIQDDVQTLNDIAENDKTTTEEMQQKINDVNNSQPEVTNEQQH